MTARGTATLRIVCGDIDALRDAVGDYLGYEDDTTPANVIDLDDVKWLDTHALIDADPAAKSSIMARGGGGVTACVPHC